MRIALVGHGHHPIPPTGWGAVEGIIWELATRLRARGHDVEIVNEHRRKIPAHLMKLHRERPLDWVHVHNERAVRGCNLVGRWKGFRVVATGHAPYDLGLGQTRTVRRHFMRLAQAPHHLCITREQQMAVTLLNPDCLTALRPNATEVDKIQVRPHGNGRAICVGRIDARKRQQAVADAVRGTGAYVDFAGPMPFGDFSVEGNSNSNYLGEWSREHLHEHLTDYSAMVLYSGAEAHPLAVIEALAAGLQVVVSPQAAANLDATAPFVHVVSRDEDLADTIEAATRTQDELRPLSRAYAEDYFDYDRYVDRYVAQLRAWSA